MRCGGYCEPVAESCAVCKTTQSLIDLAVRCSPAEMHFARLQDFWLLYATIETFFERSEALASGPLDGVMLRSPDLTFLNNTSLYDVFPTLFGAKPSCDPVTYGHGLKRASCSDALQKIAFEEDPIEIAPRGGSRQGDIRLPNRWSSCKHRARGLTCLAGRSS